MANTLAPAAVNHVMEGSAKAWSHFDPNTGNDIRDSFNIASATDNGTGDYAHSLSNNMASANYVKHVTSIKGPGAPSGSNYIVGFCSESYSTSVYGICTVGNSGPSALERDQTLSSILGDLA